MFKWWTWVSNPPWIFFGSKFWGQCQVGAWGMSTFDGLSREELMQKASRAHVGIKHVYFTIIIYVYMYTVYVQSSNNMM